MPRTFAYDCAALSGSLLVQVPETVFRHDVGLSGRNSSVDSWRCTPRNGVLARFRIAETQQ
eukprot:6061850-Pyramimonas_sp.AAC.1